MVDETSLIKIDDNIILDVSTGIIGSRKNNDLKTNSTPSIVFDEINTELDKLEEAIDNLEKSLDPRTISNLSYPDRDGIYKMEGLLTNMVLGVIIALLIIILLL
ncbi:MAG: tetrahydromethanopterin S-methyltransferase subunit B [Methanosphaera stadtmanae]|nr:tetrahydromethanopterin S-methyltransferase subunit B [Methanosphaera stadtmanae]